MQHSGETRSSSIANAPQISTSPQRLSRMFFSWRLQLTLSSKWHQCAPYCPAFSFTLTSSLVCINYDYVLFIMPFQNCRDILCTSIQYVVICVTKSILRESIYHIICPRFRSVSVCKTHPRCNSEWAMSGQ